MSVETNNKQLLPMHTYQDIMDLKPCFDPAVRGYCTRDWTGTALDVLRHPNVAAQDKLWIVLRSDWLPARILHLFAVWCAKQALKMVNPRSVVAFEVKRCWLDSQAMDQELDAVTVARNVYWTAALVAAWPAAWVAQVNYLIGMIQEDE